MLLIQLFKVLIYLIIFVTESIANGRSSLKLCNVEFLSIIVLVLSMFSKMVFSISSRYASFSSRRFMSAVLNFIIDKENFEIMNKILTYRINYDQNHHKFLVQFEEKFFPLDYLCYFWCCTFSFSCGVLAKFCFNVDLKIQLFWLAFDLDIRLFLSALDVLSFETEDWFSLIDSSSLLTDTGVVLSLEGETCSSTFEKSLIVSIFIFSILLLSS